MEGAYLLTGTAPLPTLTSTTKGWSLKCVVSSRYGRRPNGLANVKAETATVVSATERWMR